MPRDTSSRIAPIVRRLGQVALGLAGADIGMRLGSRTKAKIGPATVDARVRPTMRGGGSVVHIPPAGDATLATHKGPLRLDAMVVGIDETAARKAIAEPKKIDVGDDVKRAATTLGARSAGSALLGAAVGGAFLGRSPRQKLTGSAVGATAGFASLAGSAAYAWRTRDLASWRTPKLTGLLSRAPAVIGDLQQVPDQFERYRKQIGEITATVSGLYRNLTALPGPPPDDAIRVVWVSDIHNNPLAYDAIKALAEQYDVAFVLDSGDINDWGNAAESRTFAAIKEIPVPYVFIKGNHDGPGTLKEIAKFSNVAILSDGTPHEVGGLRLVGDADPRFTPDKSTGDDNFPKSKLAEIGKEFAQKITPERADVAVVHDPVVAGELVGAVPLVLSGHTHRRKDRVVGETVLLTQGSSGGAGLRGIRSDPPAALDISVLHFDRKTRRLHTVDDYTVGGLGLSQVSVVRRSADELGRDKAVASDSAKKK
ncbi:hypothetical protein EK0264_12035 [Epidermidibacterium keratini]|uniref:Calcineurin-like phosphoesterase domain-containing protein n=1 Tax=Epidermidibacterium keratini TaxID=1891644 RepID=A0A7L4YPW0_9ACTN|nr:metallophosphoesterase [Epidermidibacterium keratini]QHC00943.1 hypothetical protein EK0264_12035 [Epidermidibacterium keratini]